MTPNTSSASPVGIRPDAPLPDHVDVVVIGGGVVGVTTALFLARGGSRVALLEKGRIAAEQSSRNWGWIRKQGRDPRELPLMIESARLWQTIAPTLDEDIGFGPRSTTYLAQNEDELAQRAAWLDAAQDFQLDTKLLSAAETDALLGRDDRKFVGALHTPSDMTAEPSLAVPAIARRAVQEGVTIFEGCAARVIERKAGRLSAIVTERGRIGCEAAVVAGGAWSRTFLENMGVFIPQLAVRSSVFRTTPAPEVHPGGVGATGASLRRRRDGGYTVGRTNAAAFELIPAAFRHFGAFLPVLKERHGIIKLSLGKSFFGPLGHARWQGDERTPFEKTRILDPAPDQSLLSDLLATAKRLHPALGEIGIAESWAGMIDVTPDEIPIIDEVPGTEGLFVSTGLSGHGFGIGPGVGQLTAAVVTGKPGIVDPEPFKLSRFARFAS
ncbi:MAG: FAD-binding oxidoreductase [Pseudomonadota bacterium]